MCLGIPGKVIKIDANWGVAKIGEVLTRVALDLVPQVELGDHVLIHTGFAIQIIEEGEASVTWELIKELLEYDGA